MEQIEEKKNSEIKKIGIIGDGRFAEAIAYLISKVHKDVEIVMWTHKEEYAKKAESSGAFRHSKKKKKKLWFRQKMERPDNVRITNDAKDVVEGADVLFSILPAQATREVFETVFKDLIKENWGKIQAVISGTKGIEREREMTKEEKDEEEIMAKKENRKARTKVETNQRISEVLQDVFKEEKGGHGEILSEGLDILEKYGVLSGLNFAKDILYDEPMVTNIASKNRDVQSVGMETLSKDDFDDFTVLPTDDVCGAEIVGALKNVIALAAGAAKGLRCSDSTLHGLIGAGIEETKRFALAFGAQKKTFSGMRPTMRDLEGTATSLQSRNRQEGFTRARREKREKTGVAEGIKTVEAVIALAKAKNIKMPVCEAVYKIIKKEGKVADIMGELNKNLNHRSHELARILKQRVENEKQNGVK